MGFLITYLNLLKENNSLAMSSLIFQSRKVYNYLQRKIQTVTNWNKFRKTIKIILLTKAYYAIEEYSREVKLI